MDTSRDDSPEGSGHPTFMPGPRKSEGGQPSDISPARNGFVRVIRKVYHPLGFKKGYNFILFFIFAGALLGFSLARLQFLNFSNIFCGPGFDAANRALPGECYYYRRIYHERVGVILHLATVLPTGILVWLQFVPAIRHKWITFHRVNGYLLLLLSLLGAISGLMITRHAFGGALAVQVASGLLGFAWVLALVLAYINVKRLQIEEHRAWMLRAWFWAGAIITSRFIALAGAAVIGNGGYFVAMPCKVVADLVDNAQRFNSLFPACAPFVSGEDPELWATVPATYNNPQSPANVAAGIHMSFGMALWLAIFIHAVGIETYLHLTPGEHARLREVSYQRQLEAGMKHPGSAGLTGDRLGDPGEKGHFFRGSRQSSLE